MDIVTNSAILCLYTYVFYHFMYICMLVCTCVCANMHVLMHMHMCAGACKGQRVSLRYCRSTGCIKRGSETCQTSRAICPVSSRDLSVSHFPVLWLHEHDTMSFCYLLVSNLGNWTQVLVLLQQATDLSYLSILSLLVEGNHGLYYFKKPTCSHHPFQPISTTCLSWANDTSHPLTKIPHGSQPSKTPSSILCFYSFTSLIFHMQVRSHSICLSVPGSFRLKFSRLVPVAVRSGTSSCRADW